MTVEIALVGAGGMAADHLEHVAAHPDAEAVGVCATSEESARETGAPYDATPYADVATMYDAEEPDAAIVAVPPFAHLEPELLAADRDIDLLVEKPLALSRETARTVERAVTDAGLVTQVGHMYRYADAVERAVELVGDRPLALVEGRWIGGVAPLDWWPVEAKSGGQVVEQATHVYDLVRHFAGDVVDVSAHGGRRVVEEIDFPDASTASLRHESGTVSQVAASSASPASDRGVELVGEDCRLELDLRDHVLDGVVDGDPVRAEGGDPGYAAQFDAFVEAVRAGDPSAPRSPYADARRTFDLTMDVTEALDGGGGATGAVDG